VNGKKKAIKLEMNEDKSYKLRDKVKRKKKNINIVNYSQSYIPLLFNYYWWKKNSLNNRI